VEEEKEERSNSWMYAPTTHIQLQKRITTRSWEHSASDFGTNRKLTCDFLLVINTSLHHILRRFQIMADYKSNFR